MTTTETQRQGTAGGPPTPPPAAPTPDPTVPVAGPSGEAGADAGPPGGPVTPMTSLRRHWVVGAVLVLAGTALGAGAGALLPPEYTAEARVAVGSNDLRAIAVPGYAYGAGELASSTARYVDNSQALGELEPVLGEDAALVETVAASPIPESSIIRLEVTATDEAVAVRAADALTDHLLEQAERVNSSSDADALLDRYAEVSTQVADASAAVSTATSAAGAVADDPEALAAATAEVARLTAALQVLQVQQSAVGGQYESAVDAQDVSYQLRQVAAAAPASDTASAQVQRYGVLGLAVGGLLALVVAVALDRRGGRRATGGGSRPAR